MVRFYDSGRRSGAVRDGRLTLRQPGQARKAPRLIQRARLPPLVVVRARPVVSRTWWVLIMAGSSIMAMIFTVPPQYSQISTAMLKTRFKRRA